jgi:hypothetical protein
MGGMGGGMPDMAGGDYDDEEDVVDDNDDEALEDLPDLEE